MTQNTPPSRNERPLPLPPARLHIHPLDLYKKFEPQIAEKALYLEIEKSVLENENSHEVRTSHASLPHGMDGKKTAVQGPLSGAGSKTYAVWVC